MASEQDFRGYAKLDLLDEDPAIPICYEAALQQAKDAGLQEFLFAGAGDAKANLYVYALALFWYDSRGLIAIDDAMQTRLQRLRRELMYKREVTI